MEGPNSSATRASKRNEERPADGVDVFAQFNGNGAVFKDNVQSYSTVEPAIDLTASSFLACSLTIAGAPPGTP